MSVETLFLIAIAFLIMEVVVTSMGLLGFIAFLSFSYGLLIMHQTGMDELYGMSFEVIAGFGLSIFIIFAIGGYFAFRSFNRKIETGIEAMMQKPVIITSWNGTKGKIEFEGEQWQATSKDTFSKGDKAIITGYKNLTLTIEKEL